MLFSRLALLKRLLTGLLLGLPALATAALPLSPEAAAWLQAHPVVRVVSDMASPPWDYLDAQEQPAGLVPDTLQALAAATGLRFEWLPAQRRSQLENLLLAQQADLLVAYGLNITLPTSSLPVRQSLLVDQPVEVFRAVALPSGEAVATERLNLPGYTPGSLAAGTGPRPRQAAGFEAALVEVADGRARTATLPLLVAGYLIRERGLTQLALRNAPASLPPADLQWRVATEATALREILEAGFKALPPAQLQEIKARWVMALAVPLAKAEAPSARFLPTQPWMLALLLAVLMSLILLLAWAQRLWTQRKILRQQDALGSQREAVLQNYLLEVPAIIFALEKRADGQREVTQSSLAALRLFDVDPGLNQPPAEVFFRSLEPADHAGLSQALNAAEAGKDDVDCRFRVNSGQGVRWVQCVFRPRRQGKQGLSLLAVARDVSDVVQLQQRLESEQMRLDEFTATAPGVIYQFEVAANGRSRMLYVSPSLGSMRGLSRDDVLADGEAMYANMHEDDRVRVRDTVLRAARAFVPYQTEYRVRMPDGSLAWIAGSATPSSGSDGTVRFTGFSHNVTEQRRIEQQLRDSEAFLREITDAVPGFLFQLTQSADAGSRRFTFLSAGVALHGVTHEEALADARHFYDAVPLEDRKQIRDIVEHSANTLSPYRMDYRVRLKSGALIWMRSQAVPKRLPGGEIVWNGITTHINEEKFRQLEAQRAEARLKALSTALPGVIFERTVADAGDVIYPYVSAASVDLLGLTAESWMRSGEAFEALLLPDDRHRFLMACTDALRDGGMVSVDCRARRVDGQHFWLRVHLRRQEGEQKRQSLTGYLSEITDEREAQTKVALLERRMLELSGDAPAVLLQLSMAANGALEVGFASPAVLPLTGYTRDAIQRDPRLLLECLAEDERLRLLARLMSSKTERRAFSLSLVLTDAHGASKRVYASFSTPRSQEQNTSTWSAIWFESGIPQETVAKPGSPVIEGSAERLKSEFLANISHEIRTPLNAILGLGLLVQKTPLTLRQQGYLVKMQASAESLMGILNDVLDFSKLESGRLSLDARKFDLNTVLERLGDQLGSRAAEKSLELVFDLSLKLQSQFVGDARRLGQVLFHLVSNAIKFSERGVVLVQILEVERSDDQVLLSFAVSDEGIGINQEQLKRLFEPFSQGDASSTRKYGGTGLGLALSRTLVTLMGGTISVDSTPGAGSTFRFTASFEPVPAIAAMRVPPGMEGVKVLYCGGHPLSREIALARLNEAGLQAQGAAGLAQLMSSLAANTGEPIQLLLLDEPQEVLPDAARILRNNPPTAHMALILLLPPRLDDDLIDEGNTGDAAITLEKPASTAQLVNTTLLALGHIAGAAQSTALQADEGQGPFQPPASTRILVVDDDDLNQHIIRDWLEDSGCTVRLAVNGARALETLALTAFDLVLMDTDMPVLDGLAATEVLRKEPGLAQLPVIAMSAQGDAAERSRCREAGMSDLLVKPLDRREFMAMLRTWLPASPAAAEAASDAEPDQAAPELLNRMAALSHMNGSPGLYQRLLRRFVSEYQDLAGEIAVAMAENDAATAQRMVHTLKGMAGSLGALSLEKSAAAAEQAMLRGEGSEEALHTLKTVHAQTLAAMAEVLAEAPTDQAAAELPKAAMDDLERLLGEQDAEAKEVFATLRPGLQQAYPGLVGRLGVAVDNYDFDTALEVLRSMRQERSLDAVKDHAQP